VLPATVRRLSFCVFVAVLALPTPGTAFGQSSEASRTVQGAEKGRPAPVPAAGARFSLRSPDGDFVLRFRGLLHSDARFFLSDEGERAANTFVLRRVRPIVEGTVYSLFDFRIVPDFGEGRAVLQDAYLDARLRPGLQIRSGKFKSPFGLERLMSSSDLLFVERALPTSLAPNRDVGLMVHGDLLSARVSYAAGFFNGVADGSSADSDDQDAKDFVARVFVHPFRARASSVLRDLGIGAAASVGSQHGSPSVPGLPAFKSAGQQTYFRYRTDTAGSNAVIADGTRARTTVQGYYYRGPFGLLAEHVMASQDVRRGSFEPKALQHRSWQVAGSYVVTGERASYRSVSPARPVARASRHWGAVQVTARYNVLTVDREAFPVFAAPESAAREAGGWGMGMNWLLNDNVKAVLGYDRTSFSGGDATGDRPTEHVIAGRFQLSF
jgi:phosphate-selective porin OprO/OprP